MPSIKLLLKDLNLIDETSLEVFSTSTRDNKDLTVFKDSNSGIIFIDDFFTENDEYRSGDYRAIGERLYGTRDFEITVDTRRRKKDYEQFLIGKKVIDFGCGEGTFLRQARDSAEVVVGLEIEQRYVDELNNIGIRCVTDFTELETEKFDTIFCFHTLEHLHEPLEVLKSFKNFLKPKGYLVIEVPHANDFLLGILSNKDFKQFTLWSQHLILHTRRSLEQFLMTSGFKNFIIQGKQRYKLSNHLNWLVTGSPGGHKGVLSSIDSNDLTKSYEQSLQMIDATDTLVAVVCND